MYHLIALGMFALFAGIDLVARARAFPDVAGWRFKGLVFTLIYFAAATYAPLLWDSTLGEHTLLDASVLPLWTQVAGGFLALQLGIYAWHRTMHEVPLLWRIFHQMHHSAERVDIWGAFYFHPLDMIGFAFFGSLALVGGFGVSAEAGLIINVAGTFCGMFQHANIRTPRWLGFLVQRPESHAAHHERGVHGRNYGDIPIFDMLLGTFHNPPEFTGEVGFHKGGSRRMGAMLIGKRIA